jgi:hemerythrin-like domain-containing protein
VKRSPELAVLSREHHVALEIALRLRRATDTDADAVRTAARAFWTAEGREHFRQEEELVLPAFARHAPADDPDVVRVLVEHVDIRRRVADLDGGTVPVDALHELGVLLRDHVRHEERVLFPRIEAALADAELEALGAALVAADADRPAPA